MPRGHQCIERMFAFWSHPGRWRVQSGSKMAGHTLALIATDAGVFGSILSWKQRAIFNSLKSPITYQLSTASPTRPMWPTAAWWVTLSRSSTPWIFLWLRISTLSSWMLMKKTSQAVLSSCLSWRSRTTGEDEHHDSLSLVTIEDLDEVFPKTKLNRRKYLHSPHWPIENLLTQAWKP